MIPIQATITAYYLFELRSKYCIMLHSQPISMALSHVLHLILRRLVTGHKHYLKRLSSTNKILKMNVYQFIQLKTTKLKTEQNSANTGVNSLQGGHRWAEKQNAMIFLSANTWSACTTVSSLANSCCPVKLSIVFITKRICISVNFVSQNSSGRYKQEENMTDIYQKAGVSEGVLSLFIKWSKYFNRYCSSL